MISFDSRTVQSIKKLIFFTKTAKKISPKIADFACNQALKFACIAGVGGLELEKNRGIAQAGGVENKLEGIESHYKL